MGQLIDGKWVTGRSSVSDIKSDDKGRFVRGPTTFRDTVPAAESGRYHLYVSYACPWAHRTLIVRKLKKLESAISVSVVHHHMTNEGWHFSEEDGATKDHINGTEFLRDLYIKARPDVTSRVTVPVLWDKETSSIVNNESREIIGMLDDVFEPLGDNTVKLFPPDQRDPINAAIDAIYNPINNGVYRSGFAQSQEAYNEAVTELFDALDHWDTVLGKQRYMCGDSLTAADVCLFTTLVRFDLVYYVHFKTNRRHIYEYKNLGPYLRDIYQQPGVAETVNKHHIKQHYFRSHESVNPYRIVPVGGDTDLTAPHDRDRFD